jgi:cysteine/O-acetylserine efflux protein
MSLQLFPLFVFTQIAFFTPGPNTISCASMGMVVGYRRTVPYMLGITAGFFFIMLFCAFLSHAVLTAMPDFERYIRWMGAAYILWLAASVLKMDLAGNGTNFTPLSFANGIFLQLANPKVAVCGLAIYSTFLAALADQAGALVVSAVLFSLNAFVAASTWALFGTVIRRTLEKEQYRKVVNVALALLLVYSAVSLSGVLS